jgi:hypothetical protein
MTHEIDAHDEIGGPEYDLSLPNADEIPVYDTPEEAFSDAILSD